VAATAEVATLSARVEGTRSQLEASTRKLEALQGERSRALQASSRCWTACLHLT
jgi:hypothetical protein